MTVYVDDMLLRARVGRLNSGWSHLFADTTEELLDFARQLSLNPAWLQKPGTVREHFDVTSSVRAKAIMRGAIQITYPHGTAELIARKNAAVIDRKAST